MNKNCGLLIKRLILSNGADKREVKFSEGLNIISGPTDTGKTYVFQWLKYMLGSNDSPKNIPENRDYLDGYLEIYSFAKKDIITLRRVLSTNKVYIYSCPFEIINDKTEYLRVNTKGRTKLISSNMMEYIGVNSEIELRTHIGEEKYRKLAFRDFLHFSLIDEKEVIKDKTLLTTGQYVSRTVELNAFFYFISGKYTSYVSYLSKLRAGKKTKEKPQVDKTDYLDELIVETQNQLFTLQSSEDSSGISFKEELLFVTSEIKQHSEVIRETFKSTEKLKTKRLMNQELIKRFNLLKEHFNSDLRRLDFILEGGSIISNLQPENCPVCGKQLDAYHDESHHEKVVRGVNYEKLISSYSSEKEKIMLNLSDLSMTTGNLEEDIEKINEEILIEEKKYREIKQKVENELKPTQASLQEKIDKQVDAKLIKAKIEYLTNQLIRLNSQKKLFSTTNILINSPQEPTVENDVVDQNIEELMKIMNGFLINMKFPGINLKSNNVSFDFKEFDFIINGKARSVFGKGFRSIIYSVFVISLMDYCQKNNLPHAGFVLIDSPLTTYQEANGTDEEEKVPEELKVRFLNTFSNIVGSQIIILENKFSMDVNGEKMNFIEFTKDRTTGRYGFM
ncbi:hypothetical protein ACFO9Q_15255 [Paenibacillus sp. GCM10023252]|uniref:hypothetical protein n=1 Tax=Paenibacillus sp. GCM10023252 TaxID=3252649 RepID=UPI00361330FD